MSRFVILTAAAAAAMFAGVWIATAPAAKAPDTAATSPLYADCDAVRAAGKAPLHAADPGYRPGLDGNGNGIACEDDAAMPASAAPASAGTAEPEAPPVATSGDSYGSGAKPFEPAGSRTHY